MTDRCCLVAVQGDAHGAFNLGMLLWRHDPVRVLTRLASKKASATGEGGRW